MEKIKRFSFSIITLCFLFVFIVMPVNAEVEIENAEAENSLVQPMFTNISAFHNDFNITSNGKAILTSSVNARNVDECRVGMYLQRYQNRSWTTIKYWSATERGRLCGLGEIWYIMSGYQYRMMSYAYVYQDGKFVESTSNISRSIVY